MHNLKSLNICLCMHDHIEYNKDKHTKFEQQFIIQPTKISKPQKKFQSKGLKVNYILSVNVSGKKVIVILQKFKITKDLVNSVNILYSFSTTTLNILHG